MFALLTPTIVSLICDSGVKAAPWKHVGPAGYSDGSGVASAGAAQAATHIDGTAWLLGTANGGIWRTEDITKQPEPHWTQMLDSAPVTCTSISAMSKAVGDTVLAGCGASTSSEMGYRWDVANSGDWGGVMLSRDAGATWSMTGFPANTYVTALVVVNATTFYAGVRSNLFPSRVKESMGAPGVYKTTDGGKTWRLVFDKPAFDLRYRAPHLLVAVPWNADADSLYVSADAGATFTQWSTGLDWAGREPYYPNLALGDGVVFFGSLTVRASNLSDTSSGLFVRDLAELSPSHSTSAGWRAVANAPRLDEDGMPKDRMALLVNPSDDAMLFVAGNAGALAWRVDWAAGAWTEAFGKDTSDDSTPHGDCRNYYWETSTASLILLNDGGAHLRTQPTSPGGGKWHSLAGDTGAMEFISAHYEPTTNSWVGGAQDNCVQFAYNATPTTRAIGFIGGDGTVTAIDSSVTPARFYGATQFLGNFDDDDQPHARRRAHRRRTSPSATDDDHVGFGYATYDATTQKLTLTGFPVLKWFDIDQFPFFDHPYALNTKATAADGGLPVVVWARKGRGKPSGFYALPPPALARDDVSSQIALTPTLEVATDGDVYVFVAGGMSAGQPDPSVLVAMNNTHLMHRSSATNGALIAHPLATHYAPPVEFAFSTPNTYILGPVSHDRTVSMAVDPSKSSTVVVSGWTTIHDNSGLEAIHLTHDSGVTWTDITGGLPNATGVCDGQRSLCGKWRPSALLVLPVSEMRDSTVVLVGTVSGVYAAALKPGMPPSWMRLGGCLDLPNVLVAGLSYEPTSDTVTAATMGRGVYALPKATAHVQAVLRR